MIPRKSISVMSSVLVIAVMSGSSVGSDPLTQTGSAYLSRQEVADLFVTGQLWCFDALDDDTCSWTDVNLGGRDDTLMIVTAQSLEPGINLHIALELAWQDNSLCVRDFDASNVEITVQVDLDNKFDVANVRDAPPEIVDVIRNSWDDTTGGRCFRYTQVTLSDFDGVALRQDTFGADGTLERKSVLRVLPVGAQPFLGYEEMIDA